MTQNSFLTSLATSTKILPNASTARSTPTSHSQPPAVDAHAVATALASALAHVSMYESDSEQAPA